MSYPHTMLDLEIELIKCRWQKAKATKTFRAFLRELHGDRLISDWTFRNATLEDVEEPE